MTAVLSSPVVIAGPVYAYKVVDHPSGAAVLATRIGHEGAETVAYFRPVDLGVSFEDTTAPRLNCILDGDTPFGLAVSYAEHLAESGDEHFAF